MSTCPRTLVIALVAMGCGPKAETATTPVDATVAAEPDPPPPEQPPVLDCGPQVRGASEVFDAGSVLLIGEMHGTNQVPEAVGRIACHAASEPGADVILGLEMTTDNQPAVDAYLASEGETPAVNALLQAPHFASETKDGRNSQAMLGLLESVRRWKAAGAPIEVVCFDARPGSWKTGTERDAAMARTLVAIRQPRPKASLVVLTGNIHNRTVPGAPWDPAYVPMGVHVRDAFAELVSLDFRSSGGSFWVCMGDAEGKTRCGVAQSRGGEDRGAETFVERFDARDELGFDGVLYLGPVTASEPASSRSVVTGLD
jgi:hypothetical protein